ncbi:hypothetical protein BD560DRAFT_418381 [Blakeslea trispora]|nr:hypothetical protein BD560DRAFT_418381 [Blakeslea trispora]
MDKRPKRSSIVEKDYREYKRQRKSSHSDKVNTDEQAWISQLYHDIIELKDPEDDEYDLATFFLELPSKEDYPDYYEIIKQPIALDQMKAKIDAKEYTTLAEFKADLDLMISNAKRYNRKESQVYEDAVQIQKFVKQWHGSKEKAVLKLPGEAFTKPAESPPPKIIAIKLRAVEKQPPQKPKKSNMQKMKALMQVIMKQDFKKALDMVEEDKDMDPNTLVPVELFEDRFTWSPLHAACYYGDPSLVEALLAKGADIELNDTWYSATPLGWAAYGDHDQLARLLIEKYHANTKAKNIHGQVPFDLVSDADDPCWIGVFKQPPQKTMPPPPLPSQPTPTASIPLLSSSSAPRLPPPSIAQPTQPISSLQQTPSSLSNSAFNKQTISAQPFQSAYVAQQTSSDAPIKKRRGRPPKSETDAATVRPTQEIDIATFDPVAFEIELFNAIRTHTDNTNRLYSEQFEDLPDRQEYPEYYKVIKAPVSLTQIAEKMQTRQYPHLHAWMNDMKLVFENALSFNEPGSRIYRDAKLLLRLLHRLKERILARLAVPVSQEDAVFSLDLTQRHFDQDALSEDKRKSRRFLTTNKSRTHSIEPEQHAILQTAPYLVQPPSLLPPQPQQMLHHQMMQQRLLQVPQQMMPMMLQPAITNAPAMYDMNAYNAATAAAAAVAAAVNNNSNNPSTLYSPFSDPTTLNSTPKSPLDHASNEFYALCQHLDVMEAIKISSIDQSVDMTMDGLYPNHSVDVPANVEQLTIQSQLVDIVKAESKRLNITVSQNNIKLNATSEYEWQSVPLVKGLNVFKINVSANCTRPESIQPEFKSKVYHLFVTRIW